MFKIVHNYTHHSRFCGCKTLMFKSCKWLYTSWSVPWVWSFKV